MWGRGVRGAGASGPTAEGGAVFEIEVGSEGSGARTPVLERRTLIVLPGRDGVVENLRTYRYVGGAEDIGDGLKEVETEVELGVRIGLSVSEEGALDWSASWTGLRGGPRFVRFIDVDIELPTIAGVDAEGRMPAGTGFELVLPSPWPGDPERIVLRGGPASAVLDLDLVCQGDLREFILPARGRVQASCHLLRWFLSDFDVEVAQSAGPFLSARPERVRTGIDVEIHDARPLGWTQARIDRIESFQVTFPYARMPTLEIVDLRIERDRLLTAGSGSPLKLPSGSGDRPNSLTIRRISR